MRGGVGAEWIVQLDDHASQSECDQLDSGLRPSCSSSPRGDDEAATDRGGSDGALALLPTAGGRCALGSSAVGDGGRDTLVAAAAAEPRSSAGAAAATTPCPAPLDDRRRRAAGVGHLAPPPAVSQCAHRCTSDQSAPASRYGPDWRDDTPLGGSLGDFETPPPPLPPSVDPRAAAAAVDSSRAASTTQLTLLRRCPAGTSLPGRDASPSIARSDAAAAAAGYPPPAPPPPPPPPSPPGSWFPPLDSSPYPADLPSDVDRDPQSLQLPRRSTSSGRPLAWLPVSLLPPADAFPADALRPLLVR